jgi:hypothetical protein
VDNDLPAEPNDYMAAAYRDLAHQARLYDRTYGHRWDSDYWKETEGRLQRLADLYATRRELTTGELPK